MPLQTIRLGFAGCLIVLAVHTADSPARAETISIPPAKDNTLFSTDGATSNGAGDGVFSGRTGAMVLEEGTRQRAVLTFDVAGSNVPAGATVTSVALTLSLLRAAPSSNTQTHTLHRILADWGEGTSSASGGMGAPSTAGDATWLHTFFPDQFWTNPGGDFVSAVSASQTVDLTLGLYTWGSTTQMVADVQGWLDNPSMNFGWLLMGNETQLMTARKFASRENVDTAARPILTIEYTLGCPDDGLFCNGVEIAHPDQGCIHAGDPCQTATDSNCADCCNESTDSCTGQCPNGSSCNDSLFCNGADACSAGSCSVHAGSPCPAGQTCNESGDTCSGGCGSNSECNDSNPCTTDACGAGLCVNDAIAVGTLCPDDGNPCTDDACNATGTCTHPNKPNGTPCNDDLFCNGAEVCNSQSGSCIAGETPCPSSLCDEVADACVDCLADADCDDGLFCNGAETCDPQRGLCRAGVDPCLLLCEEANDACAQCLADSDCDDGSFCNGAETCVESVCRLGSVPCAEAASCDEDADLCEPADDDGEPNEPASPPDDDGDAVLNDEDQCPGTPAEEMVDELGCSASQTDEQPQPEPDTGPTASCGSDMCGAMSMTNLAIMIAASIATRTARRSRSAWSGYWWKDSVTMLRTFALRSSLTIAMNMVMVTGCMPPGGGTEEPPPGQEPPDAPEDIVSFSDDIQPILDATCVVCHSPGGSADRQGIPQDLRAESAYDDLVNQPSVQQPDLTLVAPGDPAASLLYVKVSSPSPPVGDPMPLGTPPLSESQIELIRLWIEQGAENN